MKKNLTATGPSGSSPTNMQISFSSESKSTTQYKHLGFSQNGIKKPTKLKLPNALSTKMSREPMVPKNKEYSRNKSIFNHTGTKFLFAGPFLLLPEVLGAAEAVSVETQLKSLAFTFHNLWILLAAALVFIMHLGFACLEASCVHPKNRVNILFKNVCIISLGILCYGIIGFNLMYPGAEYAGSFFGFAGFGIDPGPTGLTPEYNEAYTYWTDFIFQAMFAATAATIVSGAVAERIKLVSFFIFSAIFVAFIYPVVGMWKWGGGFLDTLAVPFYDFAGSSLVHAVGGWAALIGSMMIGPRLSQFKLNREDPSSAGNPALGVLGVFFLWFGWYGFNGGSVLSADPAALSQVFVTTSIAAAAGIFGAVGISFFMQKHFDLMMAINGALAGLVSITAGADQMGVLDSFFIGLIGGALVVLSIKALESMKIDDPVSAISVHLTCGIWGTLAVGLFGSLASLGQFQTQVAGTVAIGIFCSVAAFIIFKVVDLAIGLRVSTEEEQVGLDIYEHGVLAPKSMMQDESVSGVARPSTV